MSGAARPLAQTAPPRECSRSGSRRVGSPPSTATTAGQITLQRLQNVRTVLVSGLTGIRIAIAPSTASGHDQRVSAGSPPFYAIWARIAEAADSTRGQAPSRPSSKAPFLTHVSDTY